MRLAVDNHQNQSGESGTRFLPHWPRLMGVDLAARYLGVSPTTFKGLNIKSRPIGRRVLWDRLDLDRYADQLGDQPLSVQEATAEAAEIERRFLEKRRAKN